MKKAMIFAAGAVLAAAAVSASVYVNSGRNSMDDLFNAYVEVLAMNEALEVSTCYIDGWTGDYDYVLFCASSTDASHIYPCSSATKKYGHKSSESKCYNK